MLRVPQTHDLWMGGTGPESGYCRPGASLPCQRQVALQRWSMFVAGSQYPKRAGTAASTGLSRRHRYSVSDHMTSYHRTGLAEAGRHVQMVPVV